METIKKHIVVRLHGVMKDYGSNLNDSESEWLVNRIASFLKHENKHLDFRHFSNTCKHLETHYDSYWKINVAVFKTAFAKVNYNENA